MTIANTQSSADRAYECLLALAETTAFLTPSDRPLTESDTRAKLIDPLFKKVLGWNEAEIRRESPVTKGFVDYVLGSDYSHLLIEAKRSQPRFQLTAPGKPRRLKLSGPHLLGHKTTRSFIHQAQGYASDLGVQFCLVTNGPQLIIFRPFVPGRSWKHGTAIVYHDHDDVKNNFAEFYALLARDHVLAGALVEAFEQVDRRTTQLFAPLSFLPDPDRELVRNKLWSQISRTMAPLLTDRPEDLSAQIDVIRHCYVTTPLGDQTDKSLDRLLADTGARLAGDAAFINLRRGYAGKTAFGHRFEQDVYSATPGAYILTGGVGSGKTTFLRRFANIVEKEFVARYAAWVHIDFLPIGNVDPGELDRELRAYAFAEIRQALRQQFRELFEDGTAVRTLFAPEINEAKLTLLHGVAEDSPEWNSTVNGLVDGLFRDDERFTFAAFRALRGRGRRIAVVLDNTDQLGEAFQERVFLLAQKLAADHAALCVVTLREEKFFAAYRRGIFDAFGDRRFHIGSPDLKHVLQKRLDYGRKKFRELEENKSATDLTEGDFRRIDALLSSLISSATKKNANIVRMLATVSNGDMRHALDMFRDFLSSGNTDVDKIIRIVNRSGSYSVPFHEFAKSAILGSRRLYRSSVGHVVNVFKQSDAQSASHVTACRILARLSAAEGVASAHGEGYVEVATLLREYRESFGFADDLVQWSAELLRRNLIESEPPRVSDMRHADAIRVTASGAYYWRYLVRAFAYVDLVLVDTAIADIQLARRLATLVEKTNMQCRFERVRAYLEYLERRENDELAGVAARVGSFQEALLPALREKVEDEINVIASKLGGVDEYRPLIGR